MSGDYGVDHHEEGMEMDRDPAPQHWGQWGVQYVSAGNMGLAALMQLWNSKGLSLWLL